MASILVVDDDPMVRVTISEVLESLGHQITLATNGTEAVALFGEAEFDLVLTDIVMPGQNGIDTIVALRRIRPSARIIAMSGGGRTGIKELLPIATLMGACDTLPKPFDSTDLIVKVEAQLGQ
jgi:two-component system, chemotaxis family, chemotaxis protein CheY